MSEDGINLLPPFMLGLTDSQQRALIGARPSHRDQAVLLLPTYRDGGKLARSIYVLGLVTNDHDGYRLNERGLAERERLLAEKRDNIIADSVAQDAAEDALATPLTWGSEHMCARCGTNLRAHDGLYSQCLMADLQAPQQPSEPKITVEELVEMFGPTLPIEAYPLLTAEDGMPLAEVRQKLRALAARHGLREKVLRIVNAAWTDSAVHTAERAVGPLLALIEEVTGG